MRRADRSASAPLSVQPSAEKKHAQRRCWTLSSRPCVAEWRLDFDRVTFAALRLAAQPTWRSGTHTAWIDVRAAGESAAQLEAISCQSIGNANGGIAAVLAVRLRGKPSRTRPRFCRGVSGDILSTSAATADARPSESDSMSMRGAKRYQIGSMRCRAGSTGLRSARTGSSASSQGVTLLVWNA